MAENGVRDIVCFVYTEDVATACGLSPPVAASQICEEFTVKLAATLRREYQEARVTVVRFPPAPNPKQAWHKRRPVIVRLWGGAVSRGEERDLEVAIEKRVDKLLAEFTGGRKDGRSEKPRGGPGADAEEPKSSPESDVEDVGGV